jgi:predicted ester cyclase
VIDQVQDGRIAESWGNWDMLGVLQQLGAVR